MNCDIPCGLRANIDLTYNLWITIDYYCTNYAIVLPSTTFDDKIVYVRHIRAEVGGGTTRRCGRCVCMLNNAPLHYDVGCKKPEKFRCVLCCMQHPSLKSLGSEIVFGMCNREKVRLDEKSSCSPIAELELAIDSDYEDGLAMSHQPSSHLESHLLPGIMTLPSEMLLHCRDRLLLQMKQATKGCLFELIILQQRDIVSYTKVTSSSYRRW